MKGAAPCLALMKSALESTLCASENVGILFMLEIWFTRSKFARAIFDHVLALFHGDLGRFRFARARISESQDSAFHLAPKSLF